MDVSGRWSRVTQSSFLRSIPSISDVLEHPAAVDLSARLPRWAVRNAARKLIAEQRARLERLAGGQAACDVGDREATEGVLASTGIARLDAETAPTRASILDAVLRALPAAAQRCATPGPRPVILTPPE